MRKTFKMKNQNSDCATEEKLFTAFMKQTTNLFWMVDEDGLLLFANDSFFRYFGMDETSIGKKIVDLVPAFVADALYENHLEVLNSGTPLRKEEKVRWADGTDFSFLIHIFPINGTSGKKMLGGQAVNPSETSNTEKELRLVNQQLLDLSRVASDAIWEWDMKNDQTFRNEALLNMIGYPNEDMQGLNWWLQRIHPEDRRRVSYKVGKTTESRKPTWEDCYRFLCSDGSYKHVRDKGFIIYENDFPIKMIGSIQDVSDLKALENLLISEKMLRQKEITETVIKVQEKERARLGHELHDNVNQILTTAKLFLEMIIPPAGEQTVLKEKTIEYIMSAINEIRKLSRELVVPELNEPGLVASIQTIIDDIELSGAIKILFEHEADNCDLSSGQQLTLYRIIQEQLKNIITHSQATAATILLKCTQEQIDLAISDNGIGFDLAKTYRGIGLSNIHERTRFYDGEVIIDTQPGKGCILKVALPLTA